MAQTGLLEIGDPIVQIAWENDIDHEARLRLCLLDDEYGFAGNSSDYLVQLKDDLETKAGGTIRMSFAYRLKSRGRAGEEVLKGHEDRHRTSNYNLYVNVLRHAVAVDGPMQQQFVSYDALDLSKNLLGIWASERFEFGLHAHAAGISIVTSDVYTLNNDISAINSSYILRPNGKAAGALTSGDVISGDFLNEAKMALNLLRPKMRPARTPFGEKFVCFISNEHERDLRKSDSDFYALMVSAMQGGKVDDNPIFTNMLGCVHDIVFFKSDFVPPGLNSGGTKLKDKTRRAWIGGAGALAMGFGRGWSAPPYGKNRFQFISDSEDYNFQKQIAVQTIVGATRPRFTDPATSTVHENGVLVLETYADYGSNFSSSTVYSDWIDAGCTVEA